MRRFVPTICCCALLVTACDKKEILPGKRESIEGLTEVAKLETMKVVANGTVTVSSPQMFSEYRDVAGNKQHTSANNKISKDVKVLWKTSLGGAATNVEPVVFGGNIYTVNARGDLVCISLKDGAKQWYINVAKQPDDAVFTGGITSNGSVVYVATNIGDVVAVDTTTHKVLWKKSLKYPLRGAPLYVSGKLVANATNGKTYVLDASNGNVLWSKEDQEEITMMSGYATPALYGNSVICAYGSGDVKSYELSSGSEVWSDTLYSSNISEGISAINHVVASPVVSSGRVLATTAESNMVMFDASTGVRLWEKELGTINTPVVNNGWIFIVTQSGNAVCLSEQDGSIRWVSNVKALINDKYVKNVSFTGVLLINGDVTVFTNGGHILKLDASTGKLKSQRKIDGMGVAVSPVVVDGELIAITSRADVYAIG